MRVRVFFRGAAMSGPAGVADTVDAIERGDANGFFEIVELPGARRISILPLSPTTAMPAESYPRYSSRRRPSRINGTTRFGPMSPQSRT